MCYAPGGTVAVVERLGLSVVKAVSPLLWKDLHLAVIQVLVNGAGVLHCCGRGTCVLACNNASTKLEVGYKCHPIPSRRDDPSALFLFMLSAVPCRWVVFVEVWLLREMEGSAGSMYPTVAATESSCGWVVPLGCRSAALVVFHSQPVLLRCSGSEELYSFGGWTSA